MSYQHPDRISVVETQEVEVIPRWATLDIEIEGASLFLGNEAFKKSQEIVNLVNCLKDIDYPTENISLENVMLQSSSGALVKSSSARFSLKLDKIDLELVSKVLAVISSQKNARMNEIKYDFGDLKEQKAELRLLGCKAAKQQAQDICETLGVPLLGVYSMTCHWDEPFLDGGFHSHGRGATMSKSRALAHDLEGLSFVAKQKDTLRLVLNIDFRVGVFN